MKHHISVMLAAAAAFAAAGLQSCTDNPEYITGEQGKEGWAQVSLADFAVEVDETQAVCAPSPFAGSRAADTSAFLVNITNAEGENMLSTTMAECPEILTLPVGEGYTISVESHEQEPAAWNAPYYAGSETFSVLENQLNNIGTVVASFKNIRVSVNFSEELLAALEGDAAVEVNCAESGASLSFAHTETRSGYFKPAEGSTTLGATFRGTIKGQQVSLTKALANVAPGQHRILNFSLRKGDSNVPDEFGELVITGDGQGVSLGDGLYLNIQVNNVDVDGNITVDEQGDGTAVRPGQEEEPEQPGPGPDEPGPGPTPGDDNITIVAPGMSFTSEMTPLEGIDGNVNVTAPAGVKGILVEIDTDSQEFDSVLKEMVGATSFDLANISDPDMQAKIGGLGLPMNDAVAGKTEVNFDITAFIPLLQIYPGLHNFVITVTDNDGNSKSATLAFRWNG